MDVFGLFWLPNWLVVIVVLCVSYYLYMSWNYGVFKKLGVNGPKPSPIMGNFGEFFKKDVDPTVKWYNEYNKVWGCFETRNPVLMVGDSEMLKVILVKDFHLFTNRRFFKPLGYPMDLNMTALEDDHWKHVRNMVSPTFSGGKLRKMMPLLDQACSQFLCQIEAKVEKGEHVEIKDASSAFTLEVIASTSFGIQIDTQKNPDDPFILTSKKFFEINFKSAAVLISVFFPFVLPIMEVLKIYFIPQKYSDFFVKVMDAAIDKKKSESVKRSDFMQLMMDVRRDDQRQYSQLRDKDDPSLLATTSVGREGLTMGEIHGQGIGFFLASYDTMSKALAFTLFNLAHHRQYQEEAIREVDNLLPKNAQPTFENVSEMKYIEMCVLETLRLYPPASRFERICGGDTEVKGVKIPKGMVVAVPVRAIHLDPDIWPEPRTFKPDRFSPEGRAQMNPYSFMPFGYGPRNCIGMRFALMIIRLTIARILQNYRILPSDKTKMPIPFKQEGMLGVEGGLWVSFEKRG